MKARTIASILRERAESAQADAPAIHFYERGSWVNWTWKEYWLAAQSAAGALQEAGVRRGDHVMVLESNVRANVAALFGLWTLGAVPIEIGLPFHLTDRAAFLATLGESAQRLDSRHVILNQAFSASVGSARVILGSELESASGAGHAPDPDQATGTAFIQLTSGSTSRPRGVVIPQERAIAHLRSLSAALPCHAESVEVSWLPLHHDMGLIGGLLFPLFNGVPLHLMAPQDFQARPQLWLETMSRVRGTMSAAPPSAYALCVQLAPRLLSGGLDLSAWECAMIGAEPVSPSLLEAFPAAFGRAGFRRNAFFPVYGLAEATVAVTFPTLLGETRIDVVDRLMLETDGLALPQLEAGSTLAFTALGRPIPGTTIRVADQLGEAVEERVIGEILVQSDSLSTGYHKDPQATADAFADGWLHTGDLGYLADGQLYITGRKKELIIKGGHNLIPSALEEIVSKVPGVRPGGVAAVGVRSAERQTELVCIVAEVRGDANEDPALAGKIRTALKANGVAVDRVFLVPAKSLPKTSSGKLQRSAIHARLEAEMKAVMDLVLSGAP